MEDMSNEGIIEDIESSGVDLYELEEAIDSDTWFELKCPNGGGRDRWALWCNRGDRIVAEFNSREDAELVMGFLSIFDTRR